MKRFADHCNSFIFVLLCFATVQASAMSLDWSGRYRFEFENIANPGLDNTGTKSYFLHHLVLNPQIHAGDGLEIYSRLDILNNSTYPDSQVGGFFGDGVGTATPTDSTNTNVLSRNEAANPLMVNELYLSWNREFSSFIVGRAPLHFGLGITYNAGKGDFDHWLENRDMVAYKMTTGNFTLMPIMATLSSSSLKTQDRINDYMFFLTYDNLENGLNMGVAYQNRISPELGNDAPTSTPPDTLPFHAAKKFGGWNTQNLNLYVARTYPEFNYGVEAGFWSGKTGLENASGDSIKLDSFALIVDLGYQKKESKWSYGLKTDYVSGDNPGTPTYEGFVLNPNYEVAFFNV